MSKTGVERLEMASSMHQTAKLLAQANLREQHPNASEAELRGLLFLRFYGDDFSPEACETWYRRIVEHQR